MSSERLPSQKEDVLAGKRIVVVEDEGMTQMQLRRILPHAGLEVAGSASNGADGVIAVLAAQPDIVLMDIKMPGEIDGLEATRQILSQTSVCVVMLTAYSDYQEQAEQIGACGYIQKPITRDSLFPQLRQAVQRFEQRA